MTLVIPAEILAEVRLHAQDGYPLEAAGLILGRVDGEERHAVQLLPFPNSFDEGQRRRRYQISAADVLTGEEKAEALGLEVIGVFHSHPDHPAHASPTDREGALPWLSYLITSVRDGRARESFSWRLLEDRSAMVEEPVRVVDKSTTLEAR